MSSIAKVLLKLNINMETRFPPVLTRWRRHFLSLFLAISVTFRLQSQKLIFRIMLRRCMYLKTNMFKKIGNWVVRPLMWSLLYYSSVGQIDKILLNITRSQHFFKSTSFNYLPTKPLQQFENLHCRENQYHKYCERI